MSFNPSKPLTVRFIGAGSETLLELINATEQTLKCVEILTIFLKNLEPLSVGAVEANQSCARIGRESGGGDGDPLVVEVADACGVPGTRCVGRAA